MLLRGYINDRDKYYSNKKNQEVNYEKRYNYNQQYDPILGSDIFNELPPKKEIFKPDYQNQRNYEIFYEKNI